MFLAIVFVHVSKQVIDTNLASYRKCGKRISYDPIVMAKIITVHDEKFIAELAKLGLDLPSLAPALDLGKEMNRRAVAAHLAVKCKLDEKRAKARKQAELAGLAAASPP